MEYKQTAASGNSYSHLWDVSSAKPFDGGFAIEKDNLPNGLSTLPKGVFLKVDFTERTCKLIKTAVLYEALASDTTTLKVKKNSLLIASDVIGINSKAIVVGNIDTSNSNYDSFTITANSLGTVAQGAILQTYDSAGSSGKSAVNPDGLNITDVVIDTNPTGTVLFRVDGVVSSRLPQALTDSIKTSLSKVQFLPI